MTSVNVFDFRNDLAAYLGLVEKGDTVVIKKFNKPVAILSPYDGKVDDIKKYFGFMGKGGESGIEFENRVRRSKLEKKWLTRYARSR
jgi:antitoxin (DNA-binding transcriptional repressor) of toxin-antitoxin stability system